MWSDSTGNYPVWNIPGISPMLDIQLQNALRFIENLRDSNSHYTSGGSARYGLFFAKGSVTRNYIESSLRGQYSLTKGKGVFGFNTKISNLYAVGQVGVGTNDFNLSLKGALDVGTATIMAGYIYDLDLGHLIGIDAGFSLINLRATGQLQLDQVQIEAGET